LKYFGRSVVTGFDVLVDVFVELENVIVVLIDLVDTKG
jgi:hypothetical protein